MPQILGKIFLTINKYKYLVRQCITSGWSKFSTNWPKLSYNQIIIFNFLYNYIIYIIFPPFLSLFLPPNICCTQDLLQLTICSTYELPLPHSEVARKDHQDSPTSSLSNHLQSGLFHVLSGPIKFQNQLWGAAIFLSKLFYEMSEFLNFEKFLFLYLVALKHSECKLET